MVRHGERVEGADLVQTVAPTGEQGHIPAERDRIAGDVDDHGHTVIGESQIARGDACATPGKGASFSLEQYYGPIEPLRPGQLLNLRVKAATLAGTAEIPAGGLGTNEFRAEVFRVG